MEIDVINDALLGMDSIWFVKGAPPLQGSLQDVNMITTYH
jgi:hypothetical protein